MKWSGMKRPTFVVVEPDTSPAPRVISVTYRGRQRDDTHFRPAEVVARRHAVHKRAETYGRRDRRVVAGGRVHEIWGEQHRFRNAFLAIVRRRVSLGVTRGNGDCKRRARSRENQPRRIHRAWVRIPAPINDVSELEALRSHDERIASAADTGRQIRIGNGVIFHEDLYSAGIFVLGSDAGAAVGEVHRLRRLPPPRSPRSDSCRSSARCCRSRDR